MVIFHSYVSLPEGKSPYNIFQRPNHGRDVSLALPVIFSAKWESAAGPWDEYTTFFGDGSWTNMDDNLDDMGL